MYSVGYKISCKIVRMICNIIRDRPGTPAVGLQGNRSSLKGHPGRVNFFLSLRRSDIILITSPFALRPCSSGFYWSRNGGVCSSICLPFRWSRIRYQEKEPNERELEELNIFFIFSGKKIKRTKGSKCNTDNIIGTGNTTASMWVPFVKHFFRSSTF